MGHVDKDQNVSFAKIFEDCLVGFMQLQAIFKPVDLHVVVLHFYTESCILSL